MEEKKRIEYIDLAKGICITLVVLYHCGFYENSNKFFNLFRMPFYFFIAGMFFKDYGGLKKTFLKKTNKLIIPAIFFLLTGSFLLITAHYITHKEFLPLSGLDIFFDKWLINTPVWFLFSLFWCNIYYLLLKKITNNYFHLFLLCFALTFTGYVFTKFSIELPNYMDTSLCCMLYFWTGNYIVSTKFFNTIDKISKPFSLLIGIILLSFPCLYVFITNSTSNYRTNGYSANLFLIIALAVTAVVGLLIICSIIKKIKPLNYMGRNSIMILGTHQVILTGCIFFVEIFIDENDIDNSWLHDNLIIILTLLLSISLIPFFKKYLPGFTAQKDLIKV